MLNTEMRNMYELDGIVNSKANGVYVMPSNERINIRVRELVKYCKDNSKESCQLSKKEVERFYI